MKKMRIVVKIGSSSLTNPSGEIDHQKFDDHINAIANLKRVGHDVVIVSSGAIAAGFQTLGYPTRPITIKGKQAAAAIGQSFLIQSYIEKFQEHHIYPAQILLTRSDFSDKKRYQNAYSTLSELIERGIVPIINENDTVSIEELTFGDNDMLSALVSGLIHADQLLILTDIDGLYNANPNKDPQAKRYNHIHEITDELLSIAGDAGSNVGTGGMKSKLIAAKTALSLGVKVFIGTGNGEDKLLNIIQGFGAGTYVGEGTLPSVNKKRQWTWMHSNVSGKLYIDEGAEKAITEKGSSLLPAGILDIKGTFKKGDIVEVYGKSGLLGRGEVCYAVDDLRKCIGKRTEQLVLNHIEVIHRDNCAKALT